MTTVYLLIDQHNNYLSKEGEWISSEEAKMSVPRLFRTTMKDEAINQKVECVVKNPELRIAIETSEMSSTGAIVLECDEMLL